MSSIIKNILMASLAILLASSLGLCTVVINEVELSPPDNGTKWVELYNTGDVAADITGWTVTIVDGPWTGPIGLKGSIEPKGFYVAEGDPRWVQSINGTVSLTDSVGNIVDKTPALNDPGHNDFTWSRIPDGKNTGTTADFAFVMGTKGRSNGGSGGRPIVLGSTH
ncbi:MAG: lamin tail domain-containing protein [Methanotrichaceae archaeon]